MPQLDTSTYVSQLFWLVVCFLVLYLILSYIALPKITRVLQMREETIEAKINKASTFREEAEDLLGEYEASLASARAEAHNLYKASSNATTAEMAIKQKDILNKLSDRLHLAEQDLFRARIEASHELGKMSEDLANLILAKLTGKTPATSEFNKVKKGV